MATHTKYSNVSGPCFKNNKNVNFIYMIINIHNEYDFSVSYETDFMTLAWNYWQIRGNVGHF